MYATKEGTCWERLKLFILFAGCANEDFECARAASGGLAILSSSLDVCERIVDEKQGMTILREIAACGNAELQTRGLHILSNISQQNKKLAQIVADDQGLELLSALALTTKDKSIEKYCMGILENLQQHGVIEDIDEAHQKARNFAAETLAKFAREEEEDDEEDEDEDEVDVRPEDPMSHLPADPTQFHWPKNNTAEPVKVEEVEDEEEGVKITAASGDVVLKEKAIRPNHKDPLSSVVGTLPDKPASVSQLFHNYGLFRSVLPARTALFYFMPCALACAGLNCVLVCLPGHGKETKGTKPSVERRWLHRSRRR